MLSVRLPETMMARLNALCQETRRSKSFYIKEALQSYLEDMEDLYIALERKANPHAKYYTSEEVQAILEPVAI